MTLPRRCIATSARVVFAAFGIAAAAHAAPPAGTVALSSGLLFAQGAEGHARILAVGSAIGVGDRLVSGKAGFARIDFAGKGNVVLGPDTEVAIESGELTLVHGAMQVSGGTTVKTTLGTISGADSTYIVTYLPVDAAKVAMGNPVMLAELTPELVGVFSDASPVQIAQNTIPSGTAGRSPGLYVQVLDGAIHLTNGGGTQNFTAGQFGFTSTFQTPPVILPTNPGMQFTPPPSFSSTTGSGSAGGTGGAKPGDVDCEVR